MLHVTLINNIKINKKFLPKSMFTQVAYYATRKLPVLPEVLLPSSVAYFRQVQV